MPDPNDPTEPNSDIYDTLQREIEQLAAEAYRVAESKGYYTPEQAHPAIKCMKTVDEVTELHTLYARGHEDEPSEKIPAFTKAEEECSDAILMLLAFAHSKRMRIAEALWAKLAFNRTRPLMHGGKKW